ncbi:hypothetical protein M8J75_008431 [Diaphorina citri]|nr:hypothetical protein M8J75_008431 [Diaphorina citri]
MEVDHGPSLNSCVSSDSEDEENDGVMQQTKDSMEEEQLNCIQDPEKEILGVEDNLSNPNGNSVESQGGMYETNTRVGPASTGENLQEGTQVISTSSKEPQEDIPIETAKDEAVEMLSKDKDADVLSKEEDLEMSKSEERVVQNSPEQAAESRSRQEEAMEDCTENHFSSNVCSSSSVNSIPTSNVNLVTQTFPTYCDENTSSSPIEPEPMESNKNSSREVGLDTVLYRDKDSGEESLGSREFDLEGNSHSSDCQQGVNNNSESSNDIDNNSRTSSSKITIDASHDNVTKQHTSDISETIAEQPEESSNLDNTINNQSSTLDSSIEETVDEVNRHVSNNIEDNPMNCDSNMKVNLGENQELIGSKTITDSSEVSMNITEKDIDCKETSDDTLSSKTCQENLSSTELSEFANKCDKLVDYAGSDDDDESAESEQDNGDGLRTSDDEIKLNEDTTHIDGNETTRINSSNSEIQMNLQETIDNAYSKEHSDLHSNKTPGISEIHPQSTLDSDQPAQSHLKEPSENVHEHKVMKSESKIPNEEYSDDGLSIDHDSRSSDDELPEKSDQEMSNDGHLGPKGNELQGHKILQRSESIGDNVQNELTRQDLNNCTSEDPNENIKDQDSEKSGNETSIDGFQNPTSNNSDELSRSNKRKCTEITPKENYISEVNENRICGDDDQIDTTKANYGKTNFDVLKNIEALIQESKTSRNIDVQESQNVPRSDTELVEKLEELIKESRLTVESCEDNVTLNHLTRTSSDIVRKIEDLLIENKTSCEIYSSSHVENEIITNKLRIIERIEEILQGCCEEKQSNPPSEEISAETNCVDKTNEHLSSENNEQEDLEMGVFEATDDELDESTETDSGDEGGNVETEETNTNDREPISTNPLKRKLNMDDVKSSKVPPAKKLAISNSSTSKLRCRHCKLRFQTFLEVTKHTCKANLQNGLTGDSDSSIENSLGVEVTSSKSKPSLTAQKPVNVVPQNNTNHLVKNNASVTMSLISKPESVLDKINNETSVTTRNIEPGKSLTRKVFLCASCHIYFESWNLYLHMLEFHKRFICLYCLGMFGNSANLCDHLLKHHNLCTKHIAGETSLGYKEYTNENYILTCTTCGLVVPQNDIANHTCDFSDRSKGLNPESFMLATMTEGDGEKTNKNSVSVISLDEDTSPNKLNSATILSETEVFPRPSAVAEKAVSSLDKLTETINEVAENRTQQTLPQCESVEKQPETLSKPESPKIVESASAALSELENCHKLLIEDRNSGDETESDLEDSLNKSIMNCASETPEKSTEISLQQVTSNKAETLDIVSDNNSKAMDTLEAKVQENDRNEVKDVLVDTNQKEITSDETKETSFKEKLIKDLFDARVVLDKLERENLASGENRNEDSSSPCREEKSNVNDTTLNSSDVSSNVETNEDIVDDSPIKPNDTTNEREISAMSEDNEDDDNRDFNDSDNENSLKIDDSVFEDDDDVNSEPPENQREIPSIPTEETQEEKLAMPSFKINPLRIKIKCSNSGDTYERIKTETEIKEKEAREKRYDEAIDEVIRKSILEYEEKENQRMQEESQRIQEEHERKQREKDEYERLQQELLKKQEEYQRMQDEYVKMHANECIEQDETHEEDYDRDEEEEEDQEKENENTYNESLEETTSKSKTGITESESEEIKENEEQEVNEKEPEEPVKLIERNNDEKASLLKEELLKKCEKLFAGVDQLPEEEQDAEPEIQLASEDIQPMALSLDEKLESLEIRVVIKECVRTSCSICVYCYHATRIVVNGKQLALHILAEHRYTPVKNDTSEDLIQYIKTNLHKLEDDFFSSDTFDATDKECFKPFDNIYYCLQCSFASKYQRELTSHKRKMHPKTSQICLLCKQILLNQSELLFHYCAGVTNPNPQDNIYWCGVCGLDKIPSAFRLMVHLRKKHNTCNVCLESCANEGKLLQHILKHKIIHMCYKCNISYRNKQDITKHLFWKHGTESIVCKKCLQKRWSHVYHFCQPPARFTCDECNLTFKKSVTLKVHKRIHSGIFPYACTEEGCEKKFVSRKLLEKHIEWHRAPPKPPTPPPQDSKSDQTSEPHIDVCNVDDGTNPAQELKQSSKKKKKKSKFDLNSMNLPPLNLSSDSDSSDDDVPSEAPSNPEEPKSPANTELPKLPTTEATTLNTDIVPAQPEGTSSDKPVEPSTTENLNLSAEQSETPVENTKPTVDMPDLTADLTVQPPSAPADSTENTQVSLPPVEEPLTTTLDIVPNVWDQFKSFTQSLNVYRHVDEEHDYHVVYERPREEEPPPEVPAEATADVANPTAVDESAQNPTTAETQDDTEHGAHDKSADTTLNKTTSDDSSSDSSSSSSCGSQCGSNCSCSSSSSSSSSSSDDSSSDSDSSDPENRKKQEEKRLTKKQEKRKKVKGKHHNHSDELNVTIDNSVVEGSPPRDVTVDHEVAPPPLPPPSPIQESDLDTDVSESDEDFYDEKPQLAAPKVEEKPPPTALPPHSPVQAPPSPIHYPPPPIIPPVHTAASSRTPKKRKRPRVRNVPTSTPKTSTPVSAFKTSFKHPFMKPSPAFEKKKTPVPLISHTQYPADTPPSAPPGDDTTRSSKRKRKQNRFYGYSDDEDDNLDYDNDESEEYSIVKQPPFKKKILWKHSFNDKIPVQPPSPPPYENKIRIENPFRQKSTPDYYDTYNQSYATPDYASGAYQSSQQSSSSSSDEDDDTAEEQYQTPPVEPAPSAVPLYCYCRCPYDEVSEMIACDGEDCEIEWYHFECVNILVPPKGKWYCPQCRPKYQPF